MSLLAKLLRSNPFDNPQVPMTAENVGYFLDLFGGGRTESNEVVTPLTAMQTSTVFACVRILSEQVGTSDLRTFDITDKGKHLAFGQPIYDLLELNPNPDMSAMTFKQAVTAQILLWGNGYAKIEWNGAGQPIALWPRGAWATKPQRVQGKLMFRSTDNASGEVEWIDAADMLHIPYVSLDGQVGLSPIAQARQAVGMHLALDKFGARFFGNFAMPKVAITVPNTMKPEDKTKARADWEALQSGANQHRVAILDGGKKIETLSIPPEDAQFLQSKGFTKREICSLYGVPPQMVGDLDKAIKSNVEQQGIEFLQYTLNPLLKRWVQEVRRKLLPRRGRNANRFTVAFDTRELLRPDASTRQSYYQSGIQNGYLVQDEVREFEGLNPYPGEIGAQPSIQLNMQPLATIQKLAESDLLDPTNDIAEEQENSLLSRLEQQFFRLFRDGLGRFLNRKNRDAKGLRDCLGPVYQTIAFGLGLPEDTTFDAEVVSARSEAWSAEQLNTITRDELRTALRSLIAAAKQAPAKPTKENNNENDHQG